METEINERMAASNQLLAPYAIKHGDGLGRGINEPEDESRFPFQRDRGRIVHTQAFRRLKGKTQVFVNDVDDHHRTRLTHTLEVVGISRDVARALNLNEDLAECIALAHDLGHPPFGHAGEAALNKWMQQHGMHFEHNLQSYRICTLLESHSAQYQGLNLNGEILEGLLKHRTPHDSPNAPHVTHGPSLEAQVVNLADEIAYTAHDCEDGELAKLFSVQEVTTIPLAQEAHEQAAVRGTSLRGSIIRLLVTDLYKATQQALSSEKILTLDDVHNANVALVVFSDVMKTRLAALRTFLWKHMYENESVLAKSRAGQDIVYALCNSYAAEPTEKLQEWMQRYQCTLEESIKDYVAGMTDRFAIKQAEDRGLIDDKTRSLLAY